MGQDPSKVLDLSNQNLEQYPTKAVIEKGITEVDLSKNHMKSLPSPNTFSMIKGISLSANNLGGDFTAFQKVIKSLLSYNSLVSLDLSNNALTKFDNLLVKSDSLKRLRLSGNSLAEIEISNPNMEYLDLSQNEFNNFPKRVPFNLMYLNLNYNNIAFIKESYPLIQELHLSLNGLNGFDKNVIFPSLKILDVSRNNLKTFPSNFIEFAPRLEEIDASYNFISCIPNLPKSIIKIRLHKNNLWNLPNLAENFPNLRELDISNNAINQLTQLPLSLVELNAMSNQISQVDASYAPNLIKIDLSKNYIIDFPKIESLVLETILLSNNKIKHINVSVLPHSLQRLNLSNNDISEIPEDLFAKVPNLAYLLLCCNQIKIIPSQIEHSNIVKLALTLNPVEVLPSMPQTLEKLLVGNCCLNSIPSSLSNNSKLKEIFVSGNNLTAVPYISALEILRASRNKIVEVPQLPILLTVLDLSYNQISNVDSVNFPEKLCDLDMSFNLLKTFPPSSLIKCSSSLKVLRMGYNRFGKSTTIDLRAFEKLNLADFDGTYATIACNKNIHQLITGDVNRFKPQIKINVLKRHKAIGVAEMMGCREKMEDSVVVNYGNGDVSTYAVFDGHGGDAPAKFSTFYFNDNFMKCSEKLSTGEMSGEEFLKGSLELAESMLKSGSEGVPSCIAQGGTTVAAVVIYRNKKLNNNAEINFSNDNNINNMNNMNNNSMHSNDIYNNDMNSNSIDNDNVDNNSTDNYNMNNDQMNNSKNNNHNIENKMSNNIINNELSSNANNDTHNCKETNFGNKIISAHIGDSRVLVIANDGSIVFQTVDHRPDIRAEFERIKKEGGIIENNRTGGIMAVSRSIGDFRIKGMGSSPDIIEHEITSNDRWLIIGCDGLFDELEPEAISEICVGAVSPSRLSYDLRNAAYGCVSTDNISVIVVDLKLHLSS